MVKIYNFPSRDLYLFEVKTKCITVNNINKNTIINIIMTNKFINIFF